MTPRVFWRLAFTADPALALRGSRTSGRWNGPNAHPVYAAGSISLAALERLVYLRLDPTTGRLPQQHLFRIELPARQPAARLAAAELPADWQRMAAPLDPGAPLTALQRLGDAWWRAGDSVAWLVPSAIVPEEVNVLLHPGHPAWPRLTVTYARPFTYDPRLARA